MVVNIWDLNTNEFKNYYRQYRAKPLQKWIGGCNDYGIRAKQKCMLMNPVLYQ